MDKHVEPTASEWKALYEAADVFYETKSWKWMYDNDIFGVEDPETGEVSFCCIMGNGGQHFALGGYPGTKGLDGILKLLSGEVDEDNPDMMFLQNCLMCSWEDRQYQHKRDLAVIKSLGLKYRGRNAWPLFRLHETGYPDWFITGQQCRLLTHLLVQANEVAIRCREDKSLLEHATILSYFVRACSKTDGGEIVWHDTYREFQPYKPQYRSYSLEDEVLVQRLRSLPIDRSLVVEVDFFYIASSVHDKERPYYPTVCVLLDHNTGRVISLETTDDGVESRQEFLDLLQQFALRHRKRPAKLMFSRPEAHALFSLVAQQMKIPVQEVPRLENVLRVREGLTRF